MITFTKKYSFAHNGTHIEHFEPGQTVANPSSELLKTAINDGVVAEALAKSEKAPESEKPAAKAKKK